MRPFTDDRREALRDRVRAFAATLPRRGKPEGDARALIRAPRLLLCDEPTGNLDRAAAENVASVLLDLHKRQQTILVIVTHSPQLAERCPIRFELRDKTLVRSS